MPLIPDLSSASDAHDRRREPSPEHVRAIKKWTAELLALDDHAVITVHELDCADPACPIMETVIVVHAPGQPPRQWKFARPKAALTKAMLQLSFRFPVRG